ncbi:MAG: glycosyltransferase [Parcubacteria group bacterium]|jgi:glycosyltransferase involved in cell wall biosynthesis
MKKSVLKIAMVAPPFGATGGPEVVVKNLTDALLEKGVDVTLFAPGDWKTKAKHIHTLPKSLWNMKDFSQQTDKERRNLIIISQCMVLQYQNDFDIIHLHNQRYAASVAKLSHTPCVITLHNPIQKRDSYQLKRSGAYPVALSKGRMNTLTGYADIISNGIPINTVKYSSKNGSYLMTLGRINKHKGFDTAIHLAKKSDKKLLIFGRIGNSLERQNYFDKNIKPHLDKNIIYKGEASRKDVFAYVKNAEALLCPIRTPLSVFPLVAMEALACGTPVIGSFINALPKKMYFEMEKIGCFSNDPADLLAATKNIDRFERDACRKFAEKYFDRSLMATQYIALYNRILKKPSI